MGLVCVNKCTNSSKSMWEVYEFAGMNWYLVWHNQTQCLPRVGANDGGGDAAPPN